MGNFLGGEFSGFHNVQGIFLSEIFQDSHEIDLEKNGHRQFLTTNERSSGKSSSRRSNPVKKLQTKKQEAVRKNDSEQLPHDFFNQESFLKPPDFPENLLLELSNSEVLPCQGAAETPLLLESPKPGKTQPQEQVENEFFLKKTQDKTVNFSIPKEEDRGNYSIFGKDCCIFERENHYFQKENEDGRQILEKTKLTDQDICQLYLAEIHRKLLNIWHDRCEKEDWKEFEPLLKFVYDILNINGLKKMKDLLASFSQEIRGFESKKKSSEYLRRDLNWMHEENRFDLNLNESESFDQEISSEEEQKLGEVENRFWKSSSRSGRDFTHFNPSFNPNYSMDDDFGIIRRNGCWNKKSRNERIGLRNYGKTCYMNALFQCLYRLEPFSEEICEIEEIPNHSLGENLAKLFKSMKIRNPRQIDQNHKSLLDYIYQKRPEFQRNQVGDTSILFRAILDELSYGRDLKESPYSKMFAGNPLIKTLECQTCWQTKKIHDSIEILQVQDINFLKDNQKIFFKSSSETRFCSNHNGKSGFNCSYRATLLPKVLVVKIYDTQKSKTHVNILPKIILQQSNGVLNESTQGIEYEFIASVLNLSKGENGLHSVALVREQEEFIIYDDNSVSEGSFKTRYHPQLLFYVQKNDI